MRYFLITAGLLLIGAGCTTTEQPPTPIDPNPPNDVLVPDDMPNEDQSSSATENSYPDSVVDYALAIPNSYLPFGEEEDRTLTFEIVDEENYYIDLAPRQWDGDGSMAVFLTGEKQYLVAEWRGCGPLCEQWVYVLEYANGNWTDHTEEIWQDIVVPKNTIDLIAQYALAQGLSEDPNDIPFVPLYEIPQFGTTVRLYDQFTGLVIAEMDWAAGAFHPRFVEIGSKSISAPTENEPAS